jgi:hypothetical protein
MARGRRGGGATTNPLRQKDNMLILRKRIIVQEGGTRRSCSWGFEDIGQNEGVQQMVHPEVTRQHVKVTLRMSHLEGVDGSITNASFLSNMSLNMPISMEKVNEEVEQGLTERNIPQNHHLLKQHQTSVTGTVPQTWP